MLLHSSWSLCVYFCAYKHTISDTGNGCEKQCCKKGRTEFYSVIKSFSPVPATAGGLRKAHLLFTGLNCLLWYVFGLVKTVGFLCKDHDPLKLQDGSFNYYKKSLSLLNRDTHFQVNNLS